MLRASSKILHDFLLLKGAEKQLFRWAPLVTAILCRSKWFPKESPILMSYFHLRYKPIAKQPLSSDWNLCHYWKRQFHNLLSLPAHYQGFSSTGSSINAATSWFKQKISYIFRKISSLLWSNLHEHLHGGTEKKEQEGERGRTAFLVVSKLL